MDDPLAQTLTSGEALLWQQYLAAEAQGLRAHTLPALRQFVEALRVVQKRDVAEKYEAAMRYWGFHFYGYGDYLTHREQYRNYADYIERHQEA